MVLFIGDAAVETVAWIAAAGAVLGALIGASTGGAVDFVMERMREGRDAKVGARLVRLDLALAASQLKQTEEDGRWWVFFNTRMDGWAVHKTSLTARLDNDDFETVTQAVAELERFGADMRQAPLEEGASFRVIPDSALPQIRAMRTNATKAFNALAPIAEGATTNRLLHDQP